MEDDDYIFKGWKVLRDPHIDRMNELTMARITEGLSDQDYLKLSMEDLSKIPAETEEARKLKEEVMAKMKSMLARISEPGGDITEELGDQAEAWLKNPET